MSKITIEEVTKVREWSIGIALKGHQGECQREIANGRRAIDDLKESGYEIVDSRTLKALIANHNKNQEYMDYLESCMERNVASKEDDSGLTISMKGLTHDQANKLLALHSELISKQGD